MSRTSAPMSNQETDYVLKRNSVKTSGSGSATIVFSHGFGCDQSLWRFVEPGFREEFQTVVYDLTGCGKSDLSCYDFETYSSLEGHATDLLSILDSLSVGEVIFVGHSVSAMIGLTAALRSPERFRSLIMVGPSPCYRNDGDYRGGFEQEEIDGLLQTLDLNYLAWAHSMAPAVMQNAERPELTEELRMTLCANDPRIASHFARMTFAVDVRESLSRCATPALILQCSSDVVAPAFVGEYLQRRMPAAELVLLNAHGHYPTLSQPAEIIAAIQRYLD